MVDVSESQPPLLQLLHRASIDIGPAPLKMVYAEPRIMTAAIASITTGSSPSALGSSGVGIGHASFGDFDVGDNRAEHGPDRNHATNTGECTAQEQCPPENLSQWSNDRGDPRHRKPGGLNEWSHRHRANEMHNPKEKERGPGNNAEDEDVLLICCFGECVVHGRDNR